MPQVMVIATAAPGGTIQVKDINTGASNSYPDNLTNVNGTLFFQANDGSNGTELWKSDGTEAGTGMVRDIRSPGSGNPVFPIDRSRADDDNSF